MPPHTHTQLLFYTSNDVQTWPLVSPAVVEFIRYSELWIDPSLSTYDVIVYFYGTNIFFAYFVHMKAIMLCKQVMKPKNDVINPSS